MTRRASIGLLAALLATALASMPSSARPAQPTNDCTPDSWIGGSVDLCNGVLIYRDYVYDDYGADTGQPGAESTAIMTNPAGDQRYERDVNSADLVDLSLSLQGDELHAAFELNALFHDDSTVAVLAIDTDDDASTGGGEWEGLGVSSEGWDVLEVFEGGSPGTNLIEGDMPLPPGDRWRVQAVTAVKGGPVMNVAFRGVDETTATGTWFEDKQAAALATGDISEFGHTVEVTDMRNGVTRFAQSTPGYHERVYTSRYSIKPGEGMSYEGKWGRHGETTQVCEQEFHYFGRYQPYAIYIPDGSGPKGMQLLLHGCSANHASVVDQPGFQARFGDDLDRMIVSPLGRGPSGYYSDISERDALDVMTDARKNYEIDPDKVFAGGYSMGGYGAYRMAMFHPHRFAGLTSWVGFTGDCYNGTPVKSGRQCKSGAVGNVINFVTNLRNIPAAMLYMGEDELVHATSWTAMASRFAAQESEYIFYKHPVGEHFTLGRLDDWRKESAYQTDWSRVVNPTRVTFRTRRFLDSPAYGIRHDRAYWVSRIRGRTTKLVEVDLETYACGSRKVELEEGTTEGTDPVPWQAEFRNVIPKEELPPQNTISGTLENVRSLRIDADRTCLAGKAIGYKIGSDTAATIELSDGRTIRLEKGGNTGVMKGHTGE